MPIVSRQRASLANVENAPLVSIIIAVHNDEQFVARALESALGQTERRLEVICVDDASTDSTVSAVQEYLHDPRLRLIQLNSNSSAYQARRVGISEARARFTLFLDGDDELAPTAAEKSLQKAQANDADIVGFGVNVIVPDGQGTPRFERSLQPQHKELLGDEIVPALFPEGRPAQGHLWRYLFSTNLLKEAYSEASESSRFYRANDIPVSFLSIAYAKKYVSTGERLYRYYFRRGTSGQKIDKIGDFEFYLGAIDAFESIRGQVPRHAESCYVSARRSMIGNLLRDCVERTDGPLRAECLTALRGRVGDLDIVLAAADYCRQALLMLVSHFGGSEAPRVQEARSVVVTTAHLKTGGLRGVLATQVHHMTNAGIDVTVALHLREPTDSSVLPDARFAEITGRTWSEKIESYLKICMDANADAVIDHHLLYDEYWPFYALAARSVGIVTIGWIHSFSLRPVFNGTSRLSFMLDNARVLDTLVVLSPTDAAFWTMSGIKNVVYLPNPPSPMFIGRESGFVPKVLGEAPVELIWWGRLEQSTKQVRELIKVAAELRTLGVDFHMSIIGPDGPDLNRKALRREAERAGVADAVEVIGALYDLDLLSAIQRADIFLMTSAIEGYPLTLVEGQANGLPIIMYEMPWLAYPDGNPGIVTVPQSDPRRMAAEVIKFVECPDKYAEASIAAVDCAKSMFMLDFGLLYRQLIEARLSPEYTPDPDIVDYAKLLELSVAYSERTARTLGRARKEADDLKAKLSSALIPENLGEKTRSAATSLSTISVPSIDKFQSYRTKPMSALRSLLSRILPSTWRQANFIAERDAKWNHAVVSALADQQNQIAHTLGEIQSRLDDSSK